MLERKTILSNHCLYILIYNNDVFDSCITLRYPVYTKPEVSNLCISSYSIIKNSTARSSALVFFKSSRKNSLFLDLNSLFRNQFSTEMKKEDNLQKLLLFRAIPLLVVENTITHYHALNPSEIEVPTTWKCFSKKTNTEVLETKSHK